MRKKFQLNWYQPNDTAAMAEKLEKMAERGWLLERVSQWGFHYRKSEMQTVKYAITYFPDASIFDGRPTEGQETYADYCAAAGWEFISAYGAMQFFRSTRLNPTPIETDEREKLTAIHKSMMKTNILSYGALAAVWILNLVMRLGTWTKRPLELLSSNLNLGLLLIMSSLVIYCLALLCDYVYWYHGSKKAVEQGGNCLQPHTKGRLWLGNVLLIACVLSALTFIGDITSPGKGLIWAYSFGGMAVLMVVCHGTLALMKRKGVDRDITRFVFFALAVVMSIAYASAMVPLTLRIRDAGLMEEPEKQPAYVLTDEKGWEREVYRHQIPLKLEDLGYTVAEEDHCTYVMAGSRSMILGHWQCLQRPVWGVESELPELEYEFVEIPWKWLRDTMVERYAKKYAMAEVVDSRFGADRVFHSEYTIGYNKANRVDEYVLVYGDRIYEFTAGYDQPFTTEQLIAAAGKLG